MKILPRALSKNVGKPKSKIGKEALKLSNNIVVALFSYSTYS